jgi:hypothetical protein
MQFSAIRPLAGCSCTFEELGRLSVDARRDSSITVEISNINDRSAAWRMI